jgi:hypothetical protein
MCLSARCGIRWLDVFMSLMSVACNSAAQANRLWLTISLILPLKRSTMSLVCGRRGGHWRCSMWSCPDFADALPLAKGVPNSNRYDCHDFPFLKKVS